MIRSVAHRGSLSCGSRVLLTIGFLVAGMAVAPAASGGAPTQPKDPIRAAAPPGRIVVAERDYAPWLDDPPRLRGRSFRRAVRPRSHAASRRPRARPSVAMQRPAQPRAGAGELVAAGLEPGHIEALREAGFSVVEERSLALIPGLAVRLRPGRGLDREQAAARIRAIAPDAVVDRNSLYRQSFRSDAAAPFRGEVTAPYTLLNWPRDGRCAVPGPIGLIDTRVDRAHPALAGAEVEQETIRGPGYRPSSVEHGTAVAALIVGQGAPEGAMPRARVVAIDAFHRDGRHDAADVFDLVAALDRLAAHGVGVVNLSFTGPDNAVLAQAGSAAAQQGMILVAAAGNEGRDPGLRYPAAYDWAVAVTAVDQDGEVYREALQGPYIAFAAPGVRLLAIDGKGRPVVRTGTSFASAYVAAALALVQEASPGLSRPDAIARLAASAQNLGPPGRDEVFGWGLPQIATLCPAAR